mmetsp:Transcript_28764/g.45345  ORF Transcript_28764/g.45345 Transcript_28764/m.45345 type:complete len:82 (-) Transcript_28764:173-418(-)
MCNYWEWAVQLCWIHGTAAAAERAGTALAVGIIICAPQFENSSIAVPPVHFLRLTLLIMIIVFQGGGLEFMLVILFTFVQQ